MGSDEVTVWMKVRYERQSSTEGQVRRQRLKMAFTADWLPADISSSAYPFQCIAYTLQEAPDQLALTSWAPYGVPMQ